MVQRPLPLILQIEKEEVHKFKTRKPIQSTSYTSLPKLTLPANFLCKLTKINFIYLRSKPAQRHFLPWVGEAGHPINITSL